MAGFPGTDGTLPSVPVSMTVDVWELAGVMDAIRFLQDAEARPNNPFVSVDRAGEKIIVRAQAGENGAIIQSWKKLIVQLKGLGIKVAEYTRVYEADVPTEFNIAVCTLFVTQQNLGQLMNWAPMFLLTITSAQTTRLHGVERSGFLVNVFYFNDSIDALAFDAQFLTTVTVRHHNIVHFDALNPGDGLKDIFSDVVGDGFGSALSLGIQNRRQQSTQRGRHIVIPKETP